MPVEPPPHVSAEPGALASWVFANYSEVLQSALRVRRIHNDENGEKSQALVDKNLFPAPSSVTATNITNTRMEIFDCIAQAQRMFLQRQPLAEVFQCLLAGILNMQGSAYAYIGEIVHVLDGEKQKRNEQVEEEDRPHLQAFCRARTPTEQVAFQLDHPMLVDMENWDNLLGYALKHKQVIISNDVKNDPRASGRLPLGHISLDSFLGIPLLQDNDKVIGMLGVANRPGGYQQSDVDLLEVFALTCSSMIQAAAQRQENEHLINSLELKVQERTQKLLQANSELAAANRRVIQASQIRLQHFACMSHEIRTPLNCIIGLSSLLLESHMTPMQEESVRMIVASGDLLLTVVNDVLDYAKLDTGNVEIDVRKSNLQETLTAMIHSIQTKAAAKRIHLRTFFDAAVPEFCHTDCRRLQQILYNLLGNAIKFSPTDMPVELAVLLCRRPNQPRSGEYYPDSVEQDTLKSISSHGKSNCENDRGNCCSCTDDDSERQTRCDRSLLHKRKSFTRLGQLRSNEAMVLRFVVKDYGEGLNAEDCSRIFQPFQQASQRTEQEYGGTGLGLPITLKLVTALGGTISVASQKGKWTRFTVDIPFEDEPVSLSRTSRGLSEATILLVGEASPDREQVCHYFGEFGIKYAAFDCCAELDNAISTEGFLETGRIYICLIQEDRYDDEVFAVLSELRSAVLLTYGPEFRIKESGGHFRSLCQVLPSVLIKAMAAAVKEYQAGAERRSFRRRHSFSTIHALYQNYRILVAEDNKVNQKVLMRMLNRLGIEQVKIVNNGQEAVEADQQCHFDVILMDMEMPILGGLAACEKIMARTDRLHRFPSVVFVTANVSSSFETACQNAGGSGFLTKPFNIPDLEKVLRETDLAREIPVADEDQSETITEY